MNTLTSDWLSRQKGRLRQGFQCLQHHYHLLFSWPGCTWGPQLSRSGVFMQLWLLFSLEFSYLRSSLPHTRVGSSAERGKFLAPVTPSILIIMVAYNSIKCSTTKCSNQAAPVGRMDFKNSASLRCLWKSQFMSKEWEKADKSERCSWAASDFGREQVHFVMSNGSVRKTLQ